MSCLGSENRSSLLALKRANFAFVESLLKSGYTLNHFVINACSIVMYHMEYIATIYTITAFIKVHRDLRDRISGINEKKMPSKRTSLTWISCIPLFPVKRLRLVRAPSSISWCSLHSGEQSPPKILPVDSCLPNSSRWN